ncbi:unnamed protein product, partial [Prorocentrum cordatum]
IDAVSETFARADAARTYRKGVWRIVQVAASSAVIGGKGSEVVRAAGPTTPSTRECVAPYEMGGCAFSAQVLAGWSRATASSPMRLAQWELDPAASATVVLFYLPLGLGSDAQLRRWESEFPEASRSSGPTISGTFDVSKKAPVLLSIAGGWNGGGPSGAPKDAALKAGYGLRAAIVPGIAAVGSERQMAFFIKAVGPEGILRANAAKFESFVASVRTA